MSDKKVQRIFLVGMMGSGKSSVAPFLANALNWSYSDTDEIIERRGRSIKELFSSHGESHFRLLERDVLDGLVARRGLVVATGGGMPCHHNGMQKMLQSGFVIFLNASPEVLASRLRQKSFGRPLLNETHLLENLRELLDKRRHVYEQAHLIIDASLSLEDVTGKILADQVVSRLLH